MWKCAAASVGPSWRRRSAAPLSPQDSASGKQPSTNKASNSSEESKVSIKKESFGKTPEGEEVDLYTLTNANGLRVKIMTYGATIIASKRPTATASSRTSRSRSIRWPTTSRAIPSSARPSAATPIASPRASSRLDGKEYTLATNNGANHLHGGNKGFDKVGLEGRAGRERPTPSASLFTHDSPDGDEGYPGKLTATVTYTLTNDNELKMDYTADDRQADDRQPDQPRLLEPGRRRLGRRPRSTN